MKYVLTNADDYGYRSDISKAIIDSHTNGFLTSTTVLINFLSLEDLELAKNTPTLGFGLHLNLTSGEPVSKEWKQKYGSFSRPFRNEAQQFDREVWLPFFEKYSTEDVIHEYESQYQLFVKMFDKKPTHLDSHHYSSSFNSTFPAFVEIAKKYSLPVRLPKMWDIAQNQHPMGNITHTPDLENKLKDAGVLSTSYFSVEYLNRYDDPYTVFENELKKVNGGESIEVSFHPGYEEEWRQKDLEIIKSSQIKSTVERNGFSLINFSQLERK